MDVSLIARRAFTEIKLHSARGNNTSCAPMVRWLLDVAAARVALSQCAAIAERSITADNDAAHVFSTRKQQGSSASTNRLRGLRAKGQGGGLDEAAFSAASSGSMSHGVVSADDADGGDEVHTIRTTMPMPIERRDSRPQRPPHPGDATAKAQLRRHHHHHAMLLIDGNVVASPVDSVIMRGGDGGSSNAAGRSGGRADERQILAASAMAQLAALRHTPQGAADSQLRSLGWWSWLLSIMRDLNITELPSAVRSTGVLSEESHLLIEATAAAAAASRRNRNVTAIGSAATSHGSGGGGGHPRRPLPTRGSALRCSPDAPAAGSPHIESVAFKQQTPSTNNNFSLRSDGSATFSEDMDDDDLLDDEDEFADDQDDYQFCLGTDNPPRRRCRPTDNVSRVHWSGKAGSNTSSSGANHMSAPSSGCWQHRVRLGVSHDRLLQTVPERSVVAANHIVSAAAATILLAGVAPDLPLTHIATQVRRIAHHFTPEDDRRLRMPQRPPPEKNTTGPHRSLAAAGGTPSSPLASPKGSVAGGGHLPNSISDDDLTVGSGRIPPLQPVDGKRLLPFSKVPPPPRGRLDEGQGSPLGDVDDHEDDDEEEETDLFAADSHEAGGGMVSMLGLGLVTLCSIAMRCGSLDEVVELLKPEISSFVEWTLTAALDSTTASSPSASPSSTSVSPVVAHRQVATQVVRDLFGLMDNNVTTTTTMHDGADHTHFISNNNSMTGMPPPTPLQLSSDLRMTATMTTEEAVKQFAATLRTHQLRLSPHNLSMSLWRRFAAYSYDTRVTSLIERDAALAKAVMRHNEEITLRRRQRWLDAQRRPTANEEARSGTVLRVPRRHLAWLSFVPRGAKVAAESHLIVRAQERDSAVVVPPITAADDMTTTMTDMNASMMLQEDGPSTRHPRLTPSRDDGSAATMLPLVLSPIHYAATAHPDPGENGPTRAPSSGSLPNAIAAEESSTAHEDESYVADYRQVAATLQSEIESQRRGEEEGASPMSLTSPATSGSSQARTAAGSGVNRRVAAGDDQSSISGTAIRTISPLPPTHRPCITRHDSSVTPSVDPSAVQASRSMVRSWQLRLMLAGRHVTKRHSPPAATEEEVDATSKGTRPDRQHAVSGPVKEVVTRRFVGDNGVVASPKLAQPLHTTFGLSRFFFDSSSFCPVAVATAEAVPMPPPVHHQQQQQLLMPPQPGGEPSAAPSSSLTDPLTLLCIADDTVANTLSSLLMLRTDLRIPSAYHPRSSSPTRLGDGMGGDGSIMEGSQGISGGGGGLPPLTPCGSLRHSTGRRGTLNATTSPQPQWPATITAAYATITANNTLLEHASRLEFREKVASVPWMLLTASVSRRSNNQPSAGIARIGGGVGLGGMTSGPSASALLSAPSADAGAHPEALLLTDVLVSAIKAVAQKVDLGELSQNETLPGAQPPLDLPGRKETPATLTLSATAVTSTAPITATSFAQRAIPRLSLLRPPSMSDVIASALLARSHAMQLVSWIQWQRAASAAASSSPHHHPQFNTPAVVPSGGSGSPQRRTVPSTGHPGSTGGGGDPLLVDASSHQREAANDPIPVLASYPKGHTPPVLGAASLGVSIMDMSILSLGLLSPQSTSYANATRAILASWPPPNTSTSPPATWGIAAAVGATTTTAATGGSNVERLVATAAAVPLFMLLPAPLAALPVSDLLCSYPVDILIPPPTPSYGGSSRPSPPATTRTAVAVPGFNYNNLSGGPRPCLFVPGIVLGDVDPHTFSFRVNPATGRLSGRERLSASAMGSAGGGSLGSGVLLTSSRSGASRTPRGIRLALSQGAVTSGPPSARWGDGSDLFDPSSETSVGSSRIGGPTNPTPPLSGKGIGGTTGDYYPSDGIGGVGAAATASTQHLTVPGASSGRGTAAAARRASDGGHLTVTFGGSDAGAYDMSALDDDDDDEVRDEALLKANTGTWVAAASRSPSSGPTGRPFAEKGATQPPLPPPTAVPLLVVGDASAPTLPAVYFPPPRRGDDTATRVLGGSAVGDVGGLDNASAGWKSHARADQRTASEASGGGDDSRLLFVPSKRRPLTADVTDTTVGRPACSSPPRNATSAHAATSAHPGRLGSIDASETQSSNSGVVGGLPSKRPPSSQPPPRPGTSGSRPGSNAKYMSDPGSAYSPRDTEHQREYVTGSNDEPREADVLEVEQPEHGDVGHNDIPVMKGVPHGDSTREDGCQCCVVQ